MTYPVTMANKTSRYVHTLARPVSIHVRQAMHAM